MIDILYTLEGTNISPQKGTFEDDFPFFPRWEGFVSFLECTFFCIEKSIIFDSFPSPKISFRLPVSLPSFVGPPSSVPGKFQQQQVHSSAFWRGVPTNNAFQWYLYIHCLSRNMYPFYKCWSMCISVYDKLWCIQLCINQIQHPFRLPIAGIFHERNASQSSKLFARLKVSVGVSRSPASRSVKIQSRLVVYNSLHPED